MPEVTTLITGATKGIGRALSFAFAKYSDTLVLLARTASDLESLKNELQTEFPDTSIHLYAGDLSHDQSRQECIKLIQSQVPSVDVLINNAGRFDQGTLLDEPEGQLQEILNLNLLAAYDLCRAFVPSMKVRRSGHVFNLCSIASLQARPNCGSYVISKHALLGLNRALRLELQPFGVRVTAVLPGPTWSASWEGAPFPLERLMKPETVAQAICQTWQLGANAVVEELIIQPQLGDL